MSEGHQDQPVRLDYATPSPPHVPLCRRILAGILVLGAATVAVAGVFTGNESAMVNLLTFAFALVVGAVFVRYGNIRLL